MPTRRAARIVALSLTGVLTFGVTAGALIYDKILGGLKSEDANRYITGPRPTGGDSYNPNDIFGDSALNILVMGSDSRSDENADIAGDTVEGMRSDTQMIVHISKDRERVEVVSIPRDSWISVPSCELPDGSTTASYEGKFNGAFANGGRTGSVGAAAGCAIKAVEQTTGVPIQAYVVMDFTGFEKMIDTLGGVDMCIPHDIRSKKADLDIAAGNHRLDGKIALKYARARTGEGLGDGSDIGRISRQQELFANVAQQALGKNLLTNAPVLLNFLEAFTDSLVMSPNLSSIPNLTGLAWSLRSIRPNDIRFYTTPHGARPNDPANVVWTSDAELVWQALINDEPITPPSEPEPEPTATTDGPTQPDGETTEPEAPEPGPTTTAPATEAPSLDLDSVSAGDVSGVCE